MGEWKSKQGRLAGTITACLFGMLVFAAPGSASSYVPTTTFGTFGSGAGQLDTPVGVAVNPNGVLLVADVGNDRLQAFSSSGTPLVQIGEAGTGEGQFNDPAGVALSPDDSFWVADVANARIQKFDSSGDFVLARSTGVGGAPLSGPIGIAVDSQGQVLVSESDANRVTRFSADGTALSAFGSAGTGDGQFGLPAMVGIDSADNVLVADAMLERIQTFGPDGSFISVLGGPGTGPGQFTDPFGVAVDSAGNRFVTDHGRIQKISPLGIPVNEFRHSDGAGGFDDPFGIAIDVNNAVYVVFPSAHIVQKYELRYELQAARAGSGSGTITSDSAGVNCSTATCTTLQPEGTSVNLNATPASGSTFTGWSGACSGTGACQVTLSGDRTVTANFALDRRLTVTRAGTGSGTVTSGAAGIDCGSACSATLKEGTAVTLQAKPAAGSTFNSWTGDCSGTGDCSTAMGDDRSVTATFNLIPAVVPPSPKAKITAKPGKKTKSRTAAFRFNADVAGSTFLCRIDRKAFASCKSPRTFKGLKPGKHTFQVKAKTAGQTGPVAAYAWTIKK